MKRIPCGYTCGPQRTGKRQACFVRLLRTSSAFTRQHATTTTALSPQTMTSNLSQRCARTFFRSCCHKNYPSPGTGSAGKLHGLRLLLPASFALLLAGCVTGERLTITLPYSRITTFKAASSHNLYVQTFEDVRKERQIGVVEHKPTGEFITVKAPAFSDQNVGRWVAEAAATELRAAGHSVTVADNAPSEPPAFKISGQVLEAWGQSNGAGRARVKVKFTVTGSGSALLEKEYAGGAVVDLLSAAPGPHHVAKAFRVALQDLMKKAVPDVLAVLER